MSLRHHRVKFAVAVKLSFGVGLSIYTQQQSTYPDMPGWLQENLTFIS